MEKECFKQDLKIQHAKGEKPTMYSALARARTHFGDALSRPGLILRECVALHALFVRLCFAMPRTCIASIGLPCIHLDKLLCGLSEVFHLCCLQFGPESELCVKTSIFICAYVFCTLNLFCVFQHGHRLCHALSFESRWSRGYN